MDQCLNLTIVPQLDQKFHAFLGPEGFDITFVPAECSLTLSQINHYYFAVKSQCSHDTAVIVIFKFSILQLHGTVFSLFVCEELI
jgi:hypothetical protein